MADQQQQQVQLRIDESKMTTSFANTIRTSATGEEIILDFGYNVPMQAPGQQPTIVFNVGSRVIMNWTAAKRLAMSLGSAIRQFEAQNGEIQLSAPGAPGPAAAPTNAAPANSAPAGPGGMPDPNAG
ncbi:MAG: hypothetical protein ACI89L_001352 [Phycisphaerales bacterium]|jgi:hypothetical protein